MAVGADRITGCDHTTIRQAGFRTMGSGCHLLAVGGPSDVVARTAARINELESRWSRFLSTSEVSALNAGTGLPMVVSDGMLELVERALQARTETDGLFEPSFFGDVIRAGYDRSFDQLRDEVAPGVSELFQGSVVVIGPSVVLAPGAGFDPGGIGKGLAADLVCAEMREAGAEGASMNLVAMSGYPVSLRTGWDG